MNNIKVRNKTIIGLKLELRDTLKELTTDVRNKTIIGLK